MVNADFNYYVILWVDVRVCLPTSQKMVVSKCRVISELSWVLLKDATELPMIIREL